MIPMSEKYPEDEDYSSSRKFIVSAQNQALDSIETLNDFLEQTWQTLCCTYDASGNIPEISALFEGVDIDNPEGAAQKVLANMLLDLIENIGRFSPWYTKPARAFGLVSMREPVSRQNRWILAPEASQKWQNLLDNLSDSIEKNYCLLKAMVFMGGLMDENERCEPLVTARCACTPPRTIKISESALVKAEIRCDACMQPFSYSAFNDGIDFTGYYF